MSSRDLILNAVGQSQPAETDLPAIDIEISNPLPVDEVYEVAIKNIGGHCFRISNLEELDHFIEPGEERTINLLRSSNPDAIAQQTAAELQDLRQLYLKGSLGVAENGAIWVEETAMINRLLPFITEHLNLILDKADLVYTMHEAYRRIAVNKNGYGVFIAGPSKTADIEQSLVIGAHGPRSLRVFLVG